MITFSCYYFFFLLAAVESSSTGGFTFCHLIKFLRQNGHGGKINKADMTIPTARTINV